MHTHYFPNELVLDCAPPDDAFKGELVWITSEAGYTIGFQSNCDQWDDLVMRVEASLTVWIAVLDAEYERMRA